MPEIKVIDTTLRDAHQCLWATRMTTAMMLPVADAMDRSGFEAIDLMSAIQFDVCAAAPARGSRLAQEVSQSERRREAAASFVCRFPGR